MQLIPWSKIRYWRCIRCGSCCRHTKVQLTTFEWLKLTQLYGYRLFEQNINGFFLKKTINSQCPFLNKSLYGWYCGLQHIKPLACKLWPFRIYLTPKFGKRNEAYFKYNNREFYIYAYAQCSGIVFGKPSKIFTKVVLPDFLNIRV